MELEFQRETVSGYTRLFETTLCQEETLESIVPDACPDILRIIDVCGQAVLSEKQAQDGIAVVRGTVRASVLYQPEGGGGLRKLEVSLPFSGQCEADGLTEQGAVVASPRLCRGEARALNPRKVLLRVEVAVDLCLYQPTQRTICREASGSEDSGLCQQTFSGEYDQVAAVQEKPFSIQETIRLPSGTGEPPTVLYGRAQAVCGESKLIGSKLIFKGELAVTLLLQESGGGLTLHRETLPFSQIIEVREAGEDNSCQVRVELTELQWQTETGDGRSVELSAELAAQAVIRCRRPVTLLRDVYSTVWQMEVDTAPQSLDHVIEQTVRPQTVREMLETADRVRTVVDSRAALGQVHQSRKGEEVEWTADVWVTVLYLDENELAQCLRKTIPAVCRFPCSEQVTCLCYCRSPDEVYAAPAAGGVEVRFSIEFCCTLSRTELVPMVGDARFGQARDAGGPRRPSVVLRRAVPGESLWDLAKSYGTTTEQIRLANQLEDEALPTNRMLLIPGVRCG